MITCLIVDDEKPAREELKYILEGVEDISLVGEASNAIEALRLNEEMRPDLLFLDIKMPQISGIELAEILMGKENPPKIVFVTAYDEFAIEAFKVNAIDYLLKPIEEEEIHRILNKKLSKDLDREKVENFKLERLMDYLEGNTLLTSNRITVNKGEDMVPLHYGDIAFITVEDKTTTIYGKTGKYTSSLTLNDFTCKLPRSIFYRSHKSFIINLEYIETIETWFNSTLNLKLKYYDEKIPVSRNYVKEFKQLMNIE